MELRHLRYFVAVAEELNFSRAAAKLYIAQSSLSTQIKDLEEELGFPLFNRNASRVALTDAGRVYLSEAQDILARVKAAHERARDAVRGKAGELRIGTVGPVTFALLPAVMGRYHAENPEIDAVVHELGSRDQLTKLTSGEIHVGFMPTNVISDEQRDRFAVKSLVQCGLGVVLDKQHWFAARKTIALFDLAKETFIGLEIAGNDDHQRWIRGVCRRAGFEAFFGELAESVDNLFSMIAAGRGITLVPKLAKRPVPRGIVFRSLRERDLVYDLVMVTNPSFPSTLLARFRKIVDEEAARMQRQL